LAVYSFFYVAFYFGMALNLNPFEPIKTMKHFAPIAIALLAFPVGILSSRMVAKEREGGTLDALLTTSLQAKEILRSKWQASILRMSLPLGFLLVAFAWGLNAGGINLASFFCLTLATLVYPPLIACLGLFISTFCGTRLKAMLIFTVAFLACGWELQLI
jgi:ABC-type transport system involved in multi-copper enzyme maturation permease subunit